ncbi:hypothetical protein CHS0354_013906 [Potamilus streckersoni]|uniref:J domain-containing protein n=1 Tax=Potamilus streckersoni TaxID=2493646 RepID=A0AAE0VLB0_9BIVA|nr:hypothetical protein CHS0354_013906 [Potamilus streckersoni]
MVKNYFEVLGLKPGASEDDIKKTFRMLARQWHPDKNNAPHAEEKFKEINSAYDYLKSKDRREMLERELRPKPPPEEKYTTNNTKTSHSGGTSFFGTKTNFSDTSDRRDFGKYSHERYRESNFDTFDAGPKPSESNTSNKSSKEKKKKTKPRRKPWSQKWNSETTYGDEEDFVFRGSGKKPPFSFAFNSFVDELDSTFGLFNVNFNLGPPGFSSFFGDEDPFRDFMYQDPSLNMGQPRNPPPSRKRFVAPESGKAEGLDEEYMFTSRSGKTNSDIPYTTSDEEQGFGWDSGAETDESDGNYNNKRFRCVYCGRRFTIDRLANHESGCAKRHGYWTFSDDENEEEDEDQFSRAPGDWRQTHEDLIRHIRQARREARARKWAEAEWKEEERRVTCEWCGRKFNQVAANRHIPICKTLNKATGPAFASKSKTTSTDKARDRAKEYSKHIPKPQKKSGEVPNSPRTGKTGSTFPDLGSSRRSSYSKSQPMSSTGLNGSTAKPTRGTTKPEKSRKLYRDREKEPAPNDSSGFGIHGEGLKGTSRSHGEGCPTCSRKYGPNAKFTCSCGVKNTRA